MACRKHFIDDKLDEVLDDIDAVVILGAGLDTRAYRLTRRVRIPVFEADQPVNIARKANTVRRVLGAPPLSVRLVALDFERDDLLTSLAEHGYRTDYRAFFIWEGVTQYLTEDGRPANPGRDCARPHRAAGWCSLTSAGISSKAAIGMAPGRCTATSAQRHQLWQFGLEPDEVAGFIAEYGWRLVEQAGPDEFVQRYVEPAGRKLPASQLEWSAYAEKTY